MDYIELRKRTVFKRYHDSDIFNLKTESKLNKSSNPSKNRKTQASLEKTKDDLFNTLQNQKIIRNKPLKKKVYVQNYLSKDIFNSNFNDSDRDKKKKIRVNITASSCFDGVLNNEEYKNDLSNYTKTHRSKKKIIMSINILIRFQLWVDIILKCMGMKKVGCSPPIKLCNQKL